MTDDFWGPSADVTSATPASRDVQAEMIVRELAASLPALKIEAPLRKPELYCCLCDRRAKADGFEHRPSCLWLRAMRWVADQ